MNIRLLTKFCTFFLAISTAWLGTLVNAAEDSQNTSLREDFGYRNDGELTMTLANNIRTLNLSENVVLTQGTLEILGDLAILEFDEPTQELIKATVYGTPVSYQQQLNSDDAMVSGTSDSIVLTTEDSSGDTIIELIGNALIESPDSTMKCIAIVYLPDNDLIRKATGPCAGILSQTDQPE
jgi:lipopolysaccharide transport protein LptA